MQADYDSAKTWGQGVVSLDLARATRLGQIAAARRELSSV